MAARRREESTEVFAERYAPRAEIESTNRGEEPIESGPPAGARQRRCLSSDEQRDWLEHRASGNDGHAARVSIRRSANTARSGLVGELWAICERSNRVALATSDKSPQNARNRDLVRLQDLILG